MRINLYEEKNNITDNNLLSQVHNLIRETKDYNTLKNKIQLFTQLNHITDCGVCYETKLNINMDCGHCVCVACYLQLYKKECPFCRL